MKKFPFSRLIVLMAIAILVLPSCVKIREYIEHHPSDIGKYCKIELITVNGGDFGLQHYQFFYNNAGDPIEMRLLEGPLGRDLHFRYDKKGRLSDVLQTDPGQTFVYIWERYSYPSHRTIIDSTYNYQGNLNDPNPPGMAVSIQKMNLDETGRPVKFLRYYLSPNIPPDSFALTYDRSGNLTFAGANYDNKVNIYQTSNTWQLIYLDYSRNNLTSPPPGTLGGPPTTPASYNAYGLPTKFYGPFAAIFGLSFQQMDVVYSCDAGSR